MAMPSQLHLVSDDAPEEAAAAAVFRADARLRLWGAAVCALCTILFTIFGYPRRIPPVIAGPLAAAFLLWSAYLLVTFAARRAVRYTLSAQRLEIDRGILGKRYESVELWRGGDAGPEDSFFERGGGVGGIPPYSPDPSPPPPPRAPP